MQELLDRLREKIESRNAQDFLLDLIESYDGYFGSYLMAKQVIKDKTCDCDECNPEFDATIDGE